MAGAIVVARQAVELVAFGLLAELRYGVENLWLETAYADVWGIRKARPAPAAKDAFTGV